MLLDVNVVVARAWDSHGSGLVRVSADPEVLPHPISVPAARGVVAGLRAVGSHTFLVDDVSEVDDDAIGMVGHRQVTDAHLIVLARRAGRRLVTSDRGASALAPDDVVLLTA